MNQKAFAEKCRKTNTASGVGAIKGSEGYLKEEIHKASDDAGMVGKLDESILETEIFEFLATSDSAQEFDLDVHVEDVKALRPRDFFNLGDSWRQATKGLHCRNWGKSRDAIIRYFTTSLKRVRCPIPDSSNDLRIGFLGGVGFCKLGMHRFVAAKAWLSCHRPEHPYLIDAECYVYQLQAELKDLFIECVNRAGTLSYKWSDHGRILILKCEITGASPLFCQLELEKKVKQLKYLKVLWHRYSPLGSFKTFPAEILRLLVDDSEVMSKIQKKRFNQF